MQVLFLILTKFSVRIIDERRQRNATEGNGNLHEIIGAITSLMHGKIICGDTCSQTRFCNTLFRNLSKIFLHSYLPRGALRCCGSFTFLTFRSFAFYTNRWWNRRRHRWRRSEIPEPEILGFNCTQDISRAEGINGPYPEVELHQRCRCNVRPRTTGWMFNWAFGRARPNANVSHNPACQLTLLETSSASAHTADSDKSDNWLWIDTHVQQSISGGPRKIGGSRLRWQIAISEGDENYFYNNL